MNGWIATLVLILGILFLFAFAVIERIQNHEARIYKIEHPKNP